MHKRTLFILPILLSILSSPLLGQAPKPEKTFCWTITSPEGKVHLLGSLHLCRSDVYPLDGAILDAYEASECLVVEVDVTPEKVMPAVQGFIMEKGIYTDGTGLKDHVSAETYGKLEAFFEKRGMDLAQMGMLHPWLLSLQMANMEAMRSGFDPEQGLDSHFLKRCKSEGKALKELESATFQLEMLASFPDDLQDLALLKTIDEADQMEEVFTRMQEAWSRGDAKGLDDLLKESLEKEPRLKPYFVKVFDERNQAMAQKIEEYIAEAETHFVVVGSGHIPGERGILALLEARAEEKGYRIEQLDAAGKAPEAVEAAAAEVK